MKILGGFVGALVGIVVAVLVAVLFGWDRTGWGDVFLVAVGTLGALVGASLARRRSDRRATTS